MYLLVGSVKTGMDDGGGTLCPNIRFGFRPRSFQGAPIPPPVHESSFFVGFIMFFHVLHTPQKPPHNLHMAPQITHITPRWRPNYAKWLPDDLQMTPIDLKMTPRWQ